MKFPDKLAKLRKGCNLSQEQLAEAVGVTRQSVSKWESGDSYPDLAKIMQICKILNCKLNELLDDGMLGEASPEEKEKKNYWEDFLLYVTKTSNMFVHMTWKAKIGMFLELFATGSFLAAVSLMIYVGLSLAANRLLDIFPLFLERPLGYLFDGLLMIGLWVLSILTFLHLFKIRYLDYYVTISDANVRTQNTESLIAENRNISQFSKNVKLPKLIIRDPNHSSSVFFKGIGHMVSFIFKSIVASFSLPVMTVLIISVAGAVFGLFTKGLLFKWISLMFIGIALLSYLLIHYCYNFLFHQKQPYRQFLIVLLTGLLTCGSGLGMAVISSLDLQTVAKYEGKPYDKVSVFHLPPLEEKDSISFMRCRSLVYVVDNEINDIRLEAKTPETVAVHLSNHGRENRDYFFTASPAQNFLSFLRELKEDIAAGKVRLDETGPVAMDVVITAKQQYIDILKAKLVQPQEQ